MSPGEIDTAVRSLCRRDRRLRPLVREHGMPPLRRTRNAFASLGRAIIYQQLSGTAAGTICRRFLALYPGGRFPTPSALLATGEADLRSVGLSRQKATYLKDLAEHFVRGDIRSRTLMRGSETTVREGLKSVKGIGDWSVDMFLIFALVRPDVLPTGDLGVKKGMAAYFGLTDLPRPEQMLELAERWRPHRSFASWYMWRVSEAG